MSQRNEVCNLETEKKKKFSKREILGEMFVCFPCLSSERNYFRKRNYTEKEEILGLNFPPETEVVPPSRGNQPV